MNRVGLLLVVWILGPLLAQDPARIAAVSLEAAFRGHLEALREKRGFPGGCAAFVLPDGEIGAVAVGGDAAGVLLTTASKLMSGSIGKTYCAAVALQLVAEKKLVLDGKVRDVLGKEKWYGRLPNGDDVTLRQLLNHTSGIPEHVWKKEFQETASKAGDRAMGPVECLDYILGDKAVSAAGAQWHYADTNYVLVGLCIEQVAGRPFSTVLRERLLEPLRLEETIWNDRRELPGLACGLAGGIGFHTGPTVVLGKYFTNPAFEYCGGGLSSTTRDLARWTRELFAGEVIPESLRQEHRAGVKAGGAVPGEYGLGCFILQSPFGPAFGHSGVMPGFLSYALYYPDLRTAVAVQFPTDDGRKVGNMKRLVDDLAGLVKAALPVPAGR